MATMVDTAIQTSTDMHTSTDVPVANLRSRYKEKTSEPTANSTAQRIRDSKYRHVFATHSLERNSCLSHDAEESPSFVGFRNLMVLVLSMQPSPTQLGTTLTALQSSRISD
jgi:diacylglycerol O-acyltransferase-1